LVVFIASEVAGLIKPA